LLPERNIILDAGDGLWRLGKHADLSKPTDIFISHSHLDHVSGLHTLPLLKKGKVRIFVQAGERRAMRRLLGHPYTASLREQFVKASLCALRMGKNALEGYSVTALPLVHADPCIGMRFEFGKGGNRRTLAYCTDTGRCENYLRLASGTDLLITECGLLPGEKEYAPWPHLSPEAAAMLAKAAGCRRLILTHFAAHKYADLRSRKTAEKAARKIFPQALAARDGLALRF